MSKNGNPTHGRGPKKKQKMSWDTLFFYRFGIFIFVFILKIITVLISTIQICYMIRDRSYHIAGESYDLTAQHVDIFFLIDLIVKKLPIYRT